MLGTAAEKNVRWQKIPEVGGSDRAAGVNGRPVDDVDTMDVLAKFFRRESDSLAVDLEDAKFRDGRARAVILFVVLGQILSILSKAVAAQKCVKCRV